MGKPVRPYGCYLVGMGLPIDQNGNGRISDYSRHDRKQDAFAGIRFFISGIIILAIARSSHRKFGFKKQAVRKENHDVQKNGSFSFLTNSNVWFLLLYALLNTTLHYAFLFRTRIMQEPVRRYSIR